MKRQNKLWIRCVLQQAHIFGAIEGQTKDLVSAFDETSILVKGAA